MLKPVKLPFGEQIASARKMRNWSRARLAKETGISENSIARYEKAGVDEAGQYPIGQNLAVLVFMLDLDPRDALLGCLKNEDFETYVENKPKDVMGYPMYRSLIEEHTVCISQNAKLRSLVRAFILEKDGKIEIGDDDLEFIKQAFFEVTQHVFVEDDVFYVEQEIDDEDIDDRFKENGPDG